MRERHLTIHSNQQKHLKPFWKLSTFILFRWTLRIKWHRNGKSRWEFTSFQNTWCEVDICVSLYAHVRTYVCLLVLRNHSIKYNAILCGIFILHAALCALRWIYSICKQRSARLCQLLKNKMPRKLLSKLLNPKFEEWMLQWWEKNMLKQFTSMLYDTIEKWVSDRL